MSKETIDSFIGDLFSTAIGQRDQLYSSTCDTVKRNLSTLILSYLMEKGVTYKSSQGLYPQVNDVELFKDSKDHILFGLILEILESNTVNQQWQT